MSYGVFNWWWGEKDSANWDWLIERLDELVSDASSGEEDYKLVMLNDNNFANNPNLKIGWLDFRLEALKLPKFNLKFDSNSSYSPSFSLSAKREIRQWFEDKGFEGLHDETVSSFIRLWTSYPRFYEETIKKGQPFVWLPNATSAFMWCGKKEGPTARPKMTSIFARLDDKLDDLICIDPEANRIISKYLSDHWPKQFEIVADFSKQIMEDSS